MSFIITYKFIGLKSKAATIIDVFKNEETIKKNNSLELRDLTPPDFAIDPEILDCITTEVYHSRCIMDHNISLESSLPKWITDYFNANETRSVTRGRGCSQVLCLFVQLISNQTNYQKMVSIVNFEEIRTRQEWILGKLFSPFTDFPIIKQYQYDPNGKSIISRPVRIGYFSIKIIEDKGIFDSNKSRLRYFSPPKWSNDAKAVLNLCCGFNPYARWSRSPIQRHIVRWYWENGSSLRTSNTQPNIITDAITLATIMASPTNNSDDWDVICCRFSDQIYMFEIDTNLRRNRVNEQSTLQNLSSYSGYRFEQLVTRRFDGESCRIIDGGLRDSFYSVNTTNIGVHKVLYSVRCAAAANQDNMSKLIDEMEIVELKTRGGRRAWDSRVTALWSRAILNRIEQIHIGEKNEDFIVTEISTIPTQQLLPKTCNTAALFNFLQKTLDLITDTCVDENAVYRFHRSPFLPVIAQKMDESIEKVIPRWYVNGETPKESLLLSSQ